MPRLTIIFMDGGAMTFDGNKESFSYIILGSVLEVRVDRTIYYYPLSSIKHFTFEEK